MLTLFAFDMFGFAEQEKLVPTGTYRTVRYIEPKVYRIAQQYIESSNSSTNSVLNNTIHEYDCKKEERNL